MEYRQAAHLRLGRQPPGLTGCEVKPRGGPVTIPLGIASLAEEEVRAPRQLDDLPRSLASSPRP
jgi:hypothetical protein